MKKTVSKLIKLLICIVIVSSLTVSSASASESLGCTPAVMLERGETANPSAGTIRYVYQMPGSSGYYSSYWGGNAYAASWQCNLAALSMALSYIGVNKLPANMQVAMYPGNAVNGTSAKHLTPSSVSSGIDAMINGGGKHSPLAIWMAPYTFPDGKSVESHWIVVAGRVSGNTYRIIDPGRSQTYNATIIGNQITTSGKYTSTIGGINQFSVDSVPNSNPTLNISPTIAKTSMNPGETCVVGGSVSSTVYNISSVVAGVYRNSDGSGGAVSSVEAKRSPNSTWFNISSVDPVLYFQNIRTPGTYYFVVKATLTNGMTKTASKQFTIRGSQCGQPGISVSDAAGGKRLSVKGGSADTINYTVRRGGTVVDSGSRTGEFAKTYTTEGNYSVSAYASRSGYSNSNSKTSDFSISKAALPKIVQSVNDNSMAVNITSASSGATIYYTLDGSAPTTASTRYTGTLALQSAGTVKAIAVKNGMVNSGIAELAVKLEEPAAPTGLVRTTAEIIPEGSSVAVKWDAVNLASSYTATLYQGTKKVKTVTTPGTTATFVLASAGEYTVNVYASNYVGNSTEAAQAVTVQAKAPSTITFKDWDGSDISVQKVPYGSSATIPDNPVRKGYTFQNWDQIAKAYSVKEDAEINAVYKINTYTVKFYNKSGNQVGASQRVKYLEAATSPEAELDDIPTGYVFSGWKVIGASEDSAGDYKAVDSDLKLQAVYYWHNNELPIVAEITTARQNIKTGNYNVSVKLTNYPEDSTTAILRVSLLTKDGKLVKSGKVEAELDEDGTTTKTVTLKYSGVATKAAAVVLGMSGDDQTSSAYCQQVTADVTVQSNEVWSDWSEWSTEKPEGVSGEALDTVKQYRYSDKQTTTSTASSMNGWTRYDSKTKWNDWGGWSDWSTSAPTASDSVQVESRDSYLYYYYGCPVCGRHEPYDGGCDCGKYRLTANNMVTKWFPVPYTASNSTRYNYIYGNTQKRYTWSLGDGQQWNFSEACINYTSNTETWDAKLGRTVVRKEYHYRTRTQTTTYYYYKWSDWSDWSETEYTGDDNRKVETRTLYRTRTKVPVYSPLAGTEDTEGNVYHIKGKLSSVGQDLNGKLATVMVYKGRNTDPNEDQIQYVGQTTIGADNAYEFDVRPKTEPNSVTGDFTVALGIQGSTGLLNVDVIRYQRATYTVRYMDDDGTLISEQEVDEGANATVPTSPVKDGKRFIGWSENAINVQTDMTITALYTDNEYTVCYVDGANNTVSYNTHHYGDKLTPPDAPTAEGRDFVGWDLILDGKDTVTENLVVNAVYNTKEYTVTFVDDKDQAVSTQKVEHGKSAVPPTALNISGREFLGWSVENEWWYVTSDMTVKPVLAFQNSVDAPTYFTIPNEYEVSLFFECATEGADIYFTMDESKPDSSSEKYDGGAVVLSNFNIEEEIDEENQRATLHRTASINAIAIKEGMNDSPVQEIVYTDTIVVPLSSEATVTFEVNGGTPLDSPTKTVTMGEKFGELPTPIFYGYDFVGWYTGVEDGALIESEDVCSKDITLYAHWEKKEEVHEHTIVIDPAEEATCQKNGKTEGCHCSECNEVLVEQKTIPKTDHKWDEGVITIQPTCTEEGQKTFTCIYCAQTKKESIEPSGHMAVGIPAVSATCTEAGKTEGSRCAVCGEIIKAQKEIPALGHSFADWNQVRAATCSQTGLEERTCGTCGTKEQRPIAKTQHTTETRNQQNATCAIEGYTGDEYCAVCGELIQTGKTIEKVEHEWGAASIVEFSTCQKAGTACKTCRVCKERDYFVLPLGSHSGGSATCNKKAVCSICGEEYGALNPNKHSGKTELRNKKDATTTETGYTGDTYCLGCNTEIKHGKVIPVIPPATSAVVRVQNTSAMPGESIVVPVLIENNPGIAGFSFDLSYDDSILTLKSVTTGEALTAGQISTNGNVVNWYTMDNITTSGTILNLTFQVSDQAVAGESEISVLPHEGKPNLTNETGSKVEASYQSGYLEIRQYQIGDVNEDDDITIGDVVVLNRCVLGKQTLAERLVPVGDINDDGDLTIGDVVILNRHVLGRETIAVAREYLNQLGNYLGAGGSATISVDDVVVKQGESIQVPVWIEENTGLSGIALSFEIPEGFTLNSIEQGNLLSKGTFSTDANTATWYAPKNMRNDGELMVLNMTADEDAQSGQIGVKAKDQGDNNFTDEHGASMMVEFSAGSVSVQEASECDKNGHTPKDPVYENENEGTCEQPGTCDEVVYCKVCGQEISRTQKPLAGKHRWGNPTWTWAEDHSSAEAEFVCELNPSHTEKRTDSRIQVQNTASCDAAGEVRYTATVELDGKQYTDSESEQSAALGHEWEDSPTWTWSDDHSNATASFTCKRNKSHKETVKDSAVTSTLKSATCTEKGKTEYTAKVSFQGKEYTTKETVTIDALGHSWDDGVVTKPSSESEEGIKTFTCQTCGETRTESIAKRESRQNTITVKAKGYAKEGDKEYIRVNCNTKKAFKVDLKASVKEKAKLTYKSSNAKVKVDKKGVVTVPKKFVGAVNLTITCDATKSYEKTSKTIVLEVKPTSTQISSVKWDKKKKTANVAWKKNTTGKGYEVQYATDKRFTQNLKIINIRKNKTVKTAVKKLTKGTYYFRIRTVNGKNYSNWSKVKTLKVAK